MRKAMPTITESAAELQQRMKHETDSKKRQRLHALYLAASGQARHRQDIAALLGVHRPSVAAWFKAYAAGGVDAARPPAHDGYSLQSAARQTAGPERLFRLRPDSPLVG
jgi:hypothetical protein